MKNIFNIIGTAMIIEMTFINQNVYADIVPEPSQTNNVNHAISWIVWIIAFVVIAAICIACALGIKSIKDKNKFK